MSTIFKCILIVVSFMLQRYNIPERQSYVPVRFSTILHDLSISIHLLAIKKYHT